MPGSDLFLQTIDAVYASGLDTARVPQALEATSRLLGASGAILEVIDKSAQRPVEFFSVGLPDIARVPYIEQFAALNPRIPFALRQRAGAVIWDHQVLGEPQMARDPFYSEYLPHMGLRYFAAAIFEHTGCGSRTADAQARTCRQACDHAHAAAMSPLSARVRHGTAP